MTALINGSLPGSLLATAAGTTGARLRVGAAASWAALRDEVHRRYGWWPTITSASDAYRSLDVQERIFLARYYPARTGSGYHGDVRWWRGTRYVRRQGAAAAAVPGTSNHGLGRAVDVTGLGGFGSSRFDQFAAVASAHGWSNAEGASVGEAWHWVYLADPDTAPASNPGTSTPTSPTAPQPTTPPAPLVPISPEADMLLITYGGTTYVVTALSIQPASTVAAAVIHAATGRAPIDVDANGWSQLTAQVQACIVDTARNLKAQGL